MFSVTNFRLLLYRQYSIIRSLYTHRGTKDRACHICPTQADLLDSTGPVFLDMQNTWHHGRRAWMSRMCIIALAQEQSGLSTSHVPSRLTDIWERALSCVWVGLLGTRLPIDQMLPSASAMPSLYDNRLSIGGVREHHYWWCIMYTECII